MQIQASPTINANADFTEIPSFANIIKANSRGKRINIITTHSINVGGTGFTDGSDCFLPPSVSFAISNRDTYNAKKSSLHSQRKHYPTTNQSYNTDYSIHSNGKGIPLLTVRAILQFINYFRKIRKRII